MTALPWSLLPDESSVDERGRLRVGGCDLVDLAAEFGTPLFVYDEAHLRRRCREALDAFGDGVAYATKAFLCAAMARLAHEEGLHLDVATGGELHIALAAGVPPDRLIFHGNNKATGELVAALDANVGRIVVDSFDELNRLEALVVGRSHSAKVMVRVTPGIEAHTHEYLQTGVADSKFGFGLQSGAARSAVEHIAAIPGLDLVGVHAHIGSQIFVVDTFEKVVATLAPFVNSLGVDELSIGGGLGVPYVTGEESPTIPEWGKAVRTACAEAGITARVVAEPGRAIVAAAAVTLYTVGTIKELPIRTYVAVDGGMSDNPRPVLYDSGYEAFLPRAPHAERERPVRIVGKHCETGDVIISEAVVPADLAIGDVLATPVTGAYGHSMGSNYNMVLRPPVVFVEDGDARLVVRGETYDDLLRRDQAFF